VSAHDVMHEAKQAAIRKASLPVSQMLLRGALAGAFLGYATSLVMVILSQGLPPIVGALCFPVGFVMLVLLGLELATGNFALLPVGYAGGAVRMRDLWRNWTWVYVGNLIGSLGYALLFYLAITNYGTSNGGVLGDQVRKVAQAKTLGYMAVGASGWAAALVKGILCNWMVTLGTMLAFSSRSTIGKIAAMWLPIATFFAHGYEHSIVNMFLFPSGLMLGGKFSIMDYFIWNEIPTVVGNLVGGLAFTGLTLYATHVKTGPKRVLD